MTMLDENNLNFLPPICGSCTMIMHFLKLHCLQETFYEKTNHWVWISFLFKRSGPEDIYFFSKIKETLKWMQSHHFERRDHSCILISRAVKKNDIWRWLHKISSKAALIGWLCTGNNVWLPDTITVDSKVQTHFIAMSFKLYCQILHDHLTVS